MSQGESRGVKRRQEDLRKYQIKLLSLNITKGNQEELRGVECSQGESRRSKGRGSQRESRRFQGNRRESRGVKMGQEESGGGQMESNGVKGS